MNYNLIKNIVGLVEEFGRFNDLYTNDLEGFKKWIAANYSNSVELDIAPDWQGKDSGRTADSVISTLLVHMNKFAKNYAKAAICDSEFSTQEDFIYLINLRAFGKMTKMELIRKNIQEKSVGILIINRLMSKGWVKQESSSTDKRSKIIAITPLGSEVLDSQMQKIRDATSIVTGNLSDSEKIELITLLNKLHDFHMDIYEKNIGVEELLEKATAIKLNKK
ncbi:MarR family winged helix-turn-helix transcriptional regulator [Sphingobacterium rhinopitheci]|uniref:MarR family winged helix-turn-helix transcriptional regulator n=1 Tax=Sphingobacterium rhinopitheci TaxID=2781960 RepID=UPI001F51ADF5|nr:winged helix DNA-binding protein [Sphingobacterium rhinopitheci]MCI0919789.1 MarR family transcriptional regulator [Sphingobacterium rhinopitheci]